MEEDQDFREVGRPGDRRVIIDDLTSYEKEIGLGKKIRRRRSDFGWLKNIFVSFILVGIVVGSFYISFLIGKRALTPVKPLVSENIKPIRPLPSTVDEVFIDIDEPPAVVKTAPKAEPKPEPIPPSPTLKRVEQLYKVQVGSFSSNTAASGAEDRLKAAGFPTYVRRTDQGGWTVQVGAFQKKSQADSLVSQLNVKGFEGRVIYE